MVAHVKEPKTPFPRELPSAASSRSTGGGFLLVGESNLPHLPPGACVRVQSISFSKLQTGDYIVISAENGTAARRFVRLSTTDGVTRLVVADGDGNEQSIPFPRLLGLVSGVKLEGTAYNPNPRGILQRAAFRIRHTFVR